MTWDQLRSKKIEMSADWGEGVKIRKDKTLDYGGWKVLDWNEYEQDDSRTVIWIIPPGIAKMGKTHRIPLSTAALNILREARTLHERWGSPYVFPSSQGPHGPLHSTTMANRCQILGIDGTPHGFRTSFRNWCEEQGVPDNPSEIALAHELDKVKRSYLRSDLLAIRSTVMEYWAQYLRGDLPDDWEWTTPAATAQIKELNDKLDRLMQLHEATQERAQAAELENAALRAELNTLRALQPALGL